MARVNTGYLSTGSVTFVIINGLVGPTSDYDYLTICFRECILTDRGQLSDVLLRNGLSKHSKVNARTWQLYGMVVIQYRFQ